MPADLEEPHPALDQSLISRWLFEKMICRFQPELPAKPAYQPQAMILQAGGLQVRGVEQHASEGLLNVTTDSYGASGCRSDNYDKNTCVAAPYKAAHRMPVSFFNSSAPKV